MQQRPRGQRRTNYNRTYKKKKKKKLLLDDEQIIGSCRRVTNLLVEIDGNDFLLIYLYLAVGKTIEDTSDCSDQPEICPIRQPEKVLLFSGSKKFNYPSGALS
ncbi:hypothetical protein RUM43_000380 [Polyplax serrata]|uniref:Uncharacterized protein n=1 Tax=Polyplax serrata TaxID=468196 RepID=A0AAN8SCB2_POLSC